MATRPKRKTALVADENAAKLSRGEGVRVRRGDAAAAAEAAAAVAEEPLTCDAAVFEWFTDKNDFLRRFSGQGTGVTVRITEWQPTTPEDHIPAQFHGMHYCVEALSKGAVVAEESVLFINLGPDTQDHHICNHSILKLVRSRLVSLSWWWWEEEDLFIGT